MIRNYLKTAVRSLLKSKFYAGINLAGLSVGLAVGMLILLWVQDELSFDGFHRQASDIYKLENRVGTGASIQIWQNTVAPIGVLAKKELPEVKDVVRLAPGGMTMLTRYKEKQFNETKVTFTDPSLFSVFDFKLIKGNMAKPFADDHSLVLTKTTANRYFGGEQPIGKVIVSDSVNYTVTGVIADFPDNSSIRADIFMPMTLLGKNIYAGSSPGKSMMNDFNQFSYLTFLLLQPATATDRLATRLRDIHLRHKADDTDILYLLQPVSAMHLYRSDGTNSGIETVRMFGIIALLVLVIGCINYVNLSTARAMLRSKEVSLRKIAGAARIHLFLQFIIETAMLFMVAAALALALMYVLMPAFNALSGKNLHIDLANYHIWLVILGTIAGTLIASSIYPAILLSAFEPINALKGKISANMGDTSFRKILVVVQFSFSIVLISGTFIISKQMDFIRSKALGYDKDHVLSFRMRQIGPHYDAVKNELLSVPGVTAVTRASGNIVRLEGQTGNNSWDGKQPGQTMMVRPMDIDKDFISFFKMTLVQGRGFTGAVADTAHFILNETAARDAQIKDPIGKRFTLRGIEGTIIGIVKDFHFASMKNKIEPLVLSYTDRDPGQLYVKTTGDHAPAVIAAAARIWKTYNDGYEFNYAFLDETFDALYRSEQRTGTLFNIFAGIAILISCLGLFGLAAFTAQLRIREIGIRKVIGASVSGIVTLLAKDFVKLVFIAFIIAAPVSWYVMNSWLQDFAYKIKPGFVTLLSSGLIAIVIAILTISYQSVKAALANPVNTLRNE
ncbi:ABC transporter permease [Hufsiella ginkgonis]|uniref:ABC transporter permease n=1 Tax=Hufsiella ginkgonis TaxID=2695274 RepID=A0A7K1XSQ1_9SPHI|nr:ABC transporter permease [Hufsiella ginkgonis]MXV13982.1 ABC transporter permease [Hufsiella ginkgonis]